MRVMARRWGKALAVRIPSQLVHEAGLKEGDWLEVQFGSVPSNTIPRLPTYSLNQLLAGISATNLPDEVLDDGPMGRELL